VKPRVKPATFLDKTMYNALTSFDHQTVMVKESEITICWVTDSCSFGL